MGELQRVRIDDDSLQRVAFEMMQFVARMGDKEPEKKDRV